MEEYNNLSAKAQYDYHLINKALNGADENAYAELMNRYRDTLYFMMLKMTKDPLDAEDLTIEAFTKAFKNLKNYQPEFAFSTWLFKIAVNNCIDFLRKKRNFVSLDEPIDETNNLELACSLPANTKLPDEHIIKKEQIKQIQAIIQKLKPHYQTLIHMRYFQELSYEEISKIMKLPLGTVKAQLFRAREFIGNFLEKNAIKI